MTQNGIAGITLRFRTVNSGRGIFRSSTISRIGRAEARGVDSSAQSVEFISWRIRSRSPAAQHGANGDGSFAREKLLADIEEMRHAYLGTATGGSGSREGVNRLRAILA